MDCSLQVHRGLKKIGQSLLILATRGRRQFLLPCVRVHVLSAKIKKSKAARQKRASEKPDCRGRSTKLDRGDLLRLTVSNEGSFHKAWFSNFSNSLTLFTCTWQSGWAQEILARQAYARPVAVTGRALTETDHVCLCACVCVCARAQKPCVGIPVAKDTI